MLGYLALMLQVIEVATSGEFEKAATILAGFPAHQRMRYAADLEIVEQYFDDEKYANEMVNLNKVYTETGGCVLLALYNDEAVGAICLKKLDARYCEMKRLFVPIIHRRKGIGAALCEALLVVARQRGFTHMRLDTGTFMVESHHLYGKMGFKMIEPYYEVKGPLRDGLYFMELEL